MSAHRLDLSSDPTTRLYQGVEDYSRWSGHRTGTAEASATLDWVDGELRARGARTQRWSFGYRHYDWSAEVTLDGRPVDAIPLYYEGVGTVASDHPLVHPVRVGGGTVGEPEVLDALSRAAGEGADIAVLPVTNAVAGYPDYDGLVGVNRDPDRAVTGVPTLLIPGHLAADAARRGIHATIAAQVTAGRSDDLIGWFGEPVPDPVVVTTPLSGWFTCAAERGTGIAIALELAHRLAGETPVCFVGNTGHELDNYGLRAYLDQAFDLQPRAVVHLGASIAAGVPGPDGRLTLVPRLAAVNRRGVPGLDEALSAGNFAPSDAFPGEGAEWHQALPDAVPLLSLAGRFPRFHTPDDRPGITTSPALVAQAYAAVQAAVRAVLTVA